MELYLGTWSSAGNGSSNGYTISYTYDHDGLRSSKVVNGLPYVYYYVGNQLSRLAYGDYVLDFFYDANGTPIAMRHGYSNSNNYTVYYYITNLQGDVIRLVRLFNTYEFGRQKSRRWRLFPVSTFCF